MMIVVRIPVNLGVKNKEPSVLQEMVSASLAGGYAGTEIHYSSFSSNLRFTYLVLIAIILSLIK